MNCPSCASGDNSVKDTRPINNGTVVRRRRCCQACGFRFTTYELTKAACQQFQQELGMLNGIRRLLEQPPIPILELEADDDNHKTPELP